MRKFRSVKDDRPFRNRFEQICIKHQFNFFLTELLGNHHFSSPPIFQFLHGLRSSIFMRSAAHIFMHTFVYKQNIA